MRSAMHKHTTLLEVLFAITAVAGCATDPADDTDLAPDAGDSVDPATSSIDLDVPAELRLRATEPTAVEIAILRDGDDAQGDVTIEIGGLPDGVTAEPLTIPAGETTGTITLTASMVAPMLAPSSITIAATSGDLGAKASCTLTVVGLPGMFDPTFNTNGREVFTVAEGHSEHLRRVVATPDGGWIAIGRDFTAGFKVVAVKYDAAGQRVTSYGIGGVATLQPLIAGELADAVIDPEGRIVVLVQTGTDAFISRIDAGGIVDQDFSYGGQAIWSEVCSDLAVDSHSRVYVACGHDDVAEVLRYDADGVIDSSFDLDGRASTGIQTTTVQLAIDNQDVPILAGTWASAGFPTEQHLWRFTETGAVFASYEVYGAWLNTSVGDILCAHGRTYVSFNGLEDTTIVALQPGGAVDESYGGNGDAEIEGLIFAQLADDGAGGLITVGGNGHGRIVRLDAAGEELVMPADDYQDITYAADLFSATFQDVVMTADGRAVVVGSSDYDFALARLWL